MSDGRQVRIILEILEARTFLSAAIAPAAVGKGGGAPAPAINLELVAVHELGHSLGLAHSSDPSSIMYAYYNASYDLSNLANDPAAVQLRSIYSATNIDANATPWEDSLDTTPGNHVADVTYSFTPDGTTLDGGKRNTLFATFEAITQSKNDDLWENVFRDALLRWSDASGGTIAFHEHSDKGFAFNYSGAAQNDPNSGDIRIGAHKFDGPGKTLAHTYYPPPNGATAAGDSHYDNAENWTVAVSGAGYSFPSSSSSSSSSGSSGGSSGSSLLPARGNSDHDDVLDGLASDLVGVFA